VIALSCCRPQLAELTSQRFSGNHALLGCAGFVLRARL